MTGKTANSSRPQKAFTSAEANRSPRPWQNILRPAEQMKISIPNLSLVVLIGPSGSGKSTFARKHFLPTEGLSSDACRGMVSDDENNQTVTQEAFALLQFIAAQRL